MQMTVKDAAQALNVAEKTVYRWIQTGGLPAYRVAGEYRIDRAMLFEWATSERINFSAADLAKDPENAPLPTLAAALHARARRDRARVPALLASRPAGGPVPAQRRERSA